ncbi:MAG: tape measure protein [Eubacteriales bacterium]|nr:tape measure protein [Eubacteriales bacterium]
MADNSYTIEAVLKARDAGYFAAMDQAANKTSTLKETMLGMAGAQLAMKGVAKTWNLISSSVGSAMNRIDTMDQFNRTMELMTGSTDTAAEALDRVNTAVKGTAYGLDVASSAVQGFVSSGKDVNESIDTVVNWGDALATFGQASNENLNSVSVALQKMSNSGKVSMENIRMLTDRGIPALEIFADATGQTVSEVTGAMSKGELSTQEFLDAMNRAFTEGTERFPAVVGAAKEAGASWSATFGNMRAAVTRGVQSIITSIEDGRAKSDLPGMKNAVSNFGKGVEKTLKIVAKATGFAAEHFETFASVTEVALAGVAAHRGWEAIRSKLAEKKTAAMAAQEAFATLAGEEEGLLSISDLYSNALADEAAAEKMRTAALSLGLVVDKEGNIVKRNGKELSENQKAALLAETGAITAKTVANAVLTGQIKLTTAAQLLWNNAIKANPIGVIVTGITATVKGLKALTNWMNKSNKELQQAKKDADAQAKALEDLNAKESKLKQAFERTNKELDQRKGKADKIISSMKDLEKSTDDNVRKTEDMVDLIYDLKDVYPDLVVAVGPYDEILKDNVESIERQVEAMDQLSRIDAWKKHTEDLQAYRDQMEIEMAIAEEMMARMEEAGTDKQRTWWTFGLGTTETKEFSELKKQYEEMAETYQRTSEAAEIAKEKTAEFNEEQVRNYLSAEQSKQALLELTHAYDLSNEAAQAIIDYNERMGLSWDENAHAIVEMADTMGIGAERVVTIMENLGLSADQLSEHYDKVYEHVSGVVDAIVKAADAGFGEIKQNEALTWEEIEQNLESNRQAIETWSENLQTLMAAGVDEGVIAKLKEMGPAGAEQTRVLAEELENANGTVIKKGEKISDDAQAIVDTVNGKFADLYKTIAEASETELSAEKYIEQGKKPIEGIVQGLSTAIVENEANLKSSGEQMMEYVGAGAGGGGAPVMQAFEDTGKEVLKTVDDTGKNLEKSAEDSAKNVTAKVDEGGAELTKSVTETSDATLRETQSLVQRLNDTFTNLPADLRTAGQNSIQGLIDGIVSMTGPTVGAMVSLARRMLAAYQGEMQIHSPSRVMDKQGEYTVNPLIERLRKGAEEASKITRRLAKNLTFVDGPDPKLTSEALPQVYRGGQSALFKPDAEESAVPAYIVLQLGGTEYRVFVENIFAEHDRKLRLEGNYAL